MTDEPRPEEAAPPTDPAEAPSAEAAAPCGKVAMELSRKKARTSRSS